ncbi:MAG: siderophore ABC transporter substrate-binding protein [Kurthia sp.]|nr:siderophore ABC transporter substrate-binding protein [Candidatus Kurthia equi]
MKKWQLLTMTAALTLSLAACGDKEASETKTSTTTQTETKASASTAFPMTVEPLTKKSENRETGDSYSFEDVVFKEQPKRLVVLDYGFLDSLDALGVEGIVGIAANGGQGNMPEHLKEKYVKDGIADVGTLKEIDLEAVAAAEPDAIFISGRQSSYYEELKEITPNVVFIGSDNKDYVAGVMESVDLAAKLFGKEDKAKELEAAFEDKVKAVQEKASGYKNALVAMYSEKKVSGFDDGEDSRFAYVYNSFGFKPATTGIDTSSHGSDFSYESILKVNPEVLFVINRGTDSVDVLKKDIENDIIKKTDAYKNDKIVYLDGITWYFSSGGITTETEKIDEILNELK